MKWQTISVAPKTRRCWKVAPVQRRADRPPVSRAAARARRSEPRHLFEREQLGRWFYQHTIMPWLTRWERTIERSLFSDEGRRNHEVEFDADVLVRGDMLARFQAYRIGREVGLYSRERAAQVREPESAH